MWLISIFIHIRLKMYGNGSQSVGYGPFGGWIAISQGSQIFPSQFITIAKQQLWSSIENNFMVGVTITWGTVLKVTALGRLWTFMWKVTIDKRVSYLGFWHVEKLSNIFFFGTLRQEKHHLAEEVFIFKLAGNTWENVSFHWWWSSMF